jgi:hypothetical protein
MEIKTAVLGAVPARGAPKRSYADIWKVVRDSRPGTWVQLECEDLFELHRIQSAARGNRTLKMKTRSSDLKLFISKV